MKLRLRVTQIQNAHDGVVTEFAPVLTQKKGAKHLPAHFDGEGMDANDRAVVDVAGDTFRDLMLKSSSLGVAAAIPLVDAMPVPDAVKIAVTQAIGTIVSTAVGAAAREFATGAGALQQVAALAMQLHDVRQSGGLKGGVEYDAVFTEVIHA